MLQMRGTGCAAVVVHRKCPVTKQMQSDRLARRVKNADIEGKKYMVNDLNVMMKEKSK
ncbi:MAG: hypothetical protein IBX60_04025 [Candidatus Aminicenantes bacterium]|nr:hypothetical protein [Candidatus Aminicenantes bacterium]